MATTSLTCSLCRKPIEAGARKCTECDGWQGRWFFLNIGTPVLSLLVALVSVLSFAIPAITSAFSAPSSDIRIAFQYFEDGTAYFIASNTGSSAGSIGEAYLDFGPQNWRFPLSTGNASSRAIGPGQSRQLSFRLPCDRNQDPRIQYATGLTAGSVDMAKDPRITVVIVQFDGTTDTYSKPLDALSSIVAINARLHQCIKAGIDAPTGEETRGQPHRSGLPAGSSQPAQRQR
jgi:hypothetical protein